MGEAGGEGGGGPVLAALPAPQRPPQALGLEQPLQSGIGATPMGNRPLGGAPSWVPGGGSSGATAKLGWPGVKALEVPERENGAALPPGLGLGWWR